ncbi:MAG: FAD:protein FMN transferase, partial [bacterium]|nr:FAD:protein FMN transferase [bacterium]
PGRKLGDYFRVLSVSDVAVATSGSYRNFWRDGTSERLYSHIIDPRTGKPTTSAVISATVIAPDCATADGLATALMVMSATEGLAMIEALDQVEAVLVVQESADVTPSVLETTGIKAYDVTASLPGFRRSPF